jgi:DNA-binding beta-propeller fold protein YncE
MGSSVIVMGDAVNDTYTRTIQSPVPYPHGITIHEGIDRILVSNTVRATDFGDAGELIGIIEASTGKDLGSFKVSDKESPAGEAPVEVIFVPQSDPPVAYVTNMNGGTLWNATWNKKTGGFDAKKAYDFSVEEAKVPLEVYFSDDGARMYATTASPGKFHIFDLSEDRTEVSLVKTLDTGEGAHHVAFTKDGRYAWVQNSFINLPGMNEGSISVVDMESLTVVDTINTFIENGFNPNCMVLLPEWNHPMGH